MKMKTAYVIRNGQKIEGRNLSNKLRNYRGSRKAIKAAKRMGFPDAYAAKIEVNVDCKLKG